MAPGPVSPSICKLGIPTAQKYYSVFSPNNDLENYVISNKCDKVRRLKWSVKMDRSGEDYITRNFIIYTTHQLLIFV